ncbi:MAG TPA: GH92 family glycosyl hydrolase, partial [Ignavibacteriales bacterium]|nr:GH92 family glycosyl hydrolase [Ignavibacteriales bacterium]
MKKTLTYFLLVLACSAAFAQSENLSKYIDPFIGTGFHGHTFPGPCVPFGMVQLSPDTGNRDWDWCSGYHDSDGSLMGFSHTHLSGTGGADLGDILFMPYTGDWRTIPGSKENPEEGYRSRFSHTDEKAEAGYYSVKLESYNIFAELTATQRCGFHKYTFPKSDKSNIIIDLNHGISDEAKEAWVELVSKDEVRGVRRSGGWAPDHYVYFYAKFSKPIDEFAVAVDEKITNEKYAKGKNVKALLRFKTKAGEEVLAKVGISAISAENALANLNAEIAGWDFDRIRKQAAKAWDKQLEKVVVEGKSDAQKRVFYTSLYHALLVPYLFTDANGEYKGMDNKIHKAEGFKYYTLFSLWDTFRAAHPLYSIFTPVENNDFVKSKIAKYDEAGRLPVWELHSTETWCMIGYHSIPVIADAYLKGYGNFDIEKAYKAMKESAEDSIRGLKYYKRYGYIPYEMENNSVSITLEYAYDDWCIAQVAKKLGKQDEYEHYTKRALSYKNMFDVSTGFMRGKDAGGKWRRDFNPFNVSILGKGDFTEGNSWQYTFFVPQDINGLIDLYGGAKNFTAKLDDMFNQEPVNDNEQSLDVSGLIGQYAQGNEPSHHVAYLYNYGGEAYKTQARVKNIMTTMFTDKRDGLCGNEDCGQMSAWYVFSALGFYPVNPADGVYVIGSPVFDKAELTLSNGKKFAVTAKNVSDKNIYIQSAALNGKPYNYSYITHKDLLKGGELVFVMGSEPSNWGCAEGERPV